MGAGGAWPFSPSRGRQAFSDWRATRADRHEAITASDGCVRRAGAAECEAGPVPGYLLVADRNNNRLLILSRPTKKIVWRFPRPGDIRRGQSFRDPDDAFFTPG